MCFLFRYDPTAPRMGPPGYGAPPMPRHRAPHPLQHQQQPQYPTYQPTPTDSMYSMGADQHAGMGLSDLQGWGGQPPPQPYGVQPMGYGPQGPPQRQTQSG